MSRARRTSRLAQTFEESSILTVGVHNLIVRLKDISRAGSDLSREVSVFEVLVRDQKREGRLNAAPEVQSVLLIDHVHCWLIDGQCLRSH